MKSQSSLLLLLCVFAVALPAATAAAAAKPNVILIYSDDHGYADLAAQKTDPDILWVAKTR